VKIQPRNADAWVIMSNCHFTLGRLDESARCFRVAYNIDITDVHSRLREGLISFKSGRFDDGIKALSGIFGILLR